MPTVTSEPLYRITICGTAREPATHPTLGPLPAIPEDGGVSAELREWMLSEGIYPVQDRGPHVGGDVTYDALFRPADATRVLTYLAGRGLSAPKAAA